jgi:hypothetical protein
MRVHIRGKEGRERSCERANGWLQISEFRVTLKLTVSQSVRPGVEPNLGLLTGDFFFFFSVS